MGINTNFALGFRRKAKSHGRFLRVVRPKLTRHTTRFRAVPLALHDALPLTEKCHG